MDNLGSYQPELEQLGLTYTMSLVGPKKPNNRPQMVYPAVLEEKCREQLKQNFKFLNCPLNLWGMIVYG